MILAATLVAAALLPAAAQSPAIVCGTVVDSAGARIPRVTVALRSSAGDDASAVTDENGNFRFASVDAGRYTITFTISGFKKTVRPNLDVRDGADVPVDQRLEAAKRPGETVVADAGRGSVSVNTKTDSGTFSKDITKRASDQPRPCRER